MGGNIAWTLRLHDGTEYRMDRWTNSLPYHIGHPAFFDGDSDHIADGLASWLQMKSDWEAHKDDENYNLPMTRAYAPYPYGLHPSQYGLVVTDFMTNTILSMQGYSDLDRIFLHEVEFGVDGVDMLSEDRNERLQAVLAADRVARYEMVTRTQKARDILMALPGATDETLAKGVARITLPAETGLDRLVAATAPLRGNTLLGKPRSDILAADLVIDTSPFTLETFSEDIPGLRALRKRIADLDFSMTSHEQDAWNRYERDMAS